MMGGMRREQLSMGKRQVSYLVSEIAGAEDTLIPAAAIQQMHGAIKKSVLATIPSAGHLPNLEQTPSFDVELHRFLQRF